MQNGRVIGYLKLLMYWTMRLKLHSAWQNEHKSRFRLYTAPVEGRPALSGGAIQTNQMTPSTFKYLHILSTDASHVADQKTGMSYACIDVRDCISEGVSNDSQRSCQALGPLIERVTLACLLVC